MATFTKMILSGSTNGLAIPITSIATPGTTIHTAVAGTSSIDEVWIYATNASASDLNLTLEWGEATVPNGNVIKGIKAYEGIILVVPGLLLQNGNVIKAFATATDAINIHGYVNRIA